MRILQQKSPEFRWEGEESTSRERRKLAFHYKSFFLDDVKFNIEDFVLVRNDDSVDPEDISNCYVGQIKALYDTGDEFEPHQAKVQWYSRVTELPPHARKNFDQIYDYELVEENRPHWSNVVDADTIFGKCEMHFLSLTADFHSFNSILEESEVPAFFCRYKFSGINLTQKLRTGPQSLQNSPMSSPKMDTKSKRKATNTTPNPKNSRYIAMATGTKEFPRVLIKKLDDRVLESQKGSVRIIVAQPHAKTIDDVTDALKNSLSLNSPRKDVEKRPIIHSLSHNVKERTLSTSDDISQDPEPSNPKKYKKNTKEINSTRSQSRTPIRAQRIKGIVPMEDSSDDNNKNQELSSPSKSKRIASITSESEMKSRSSSKSRSGTVTKTPKTECCVLTSDDSDANSKNQLLSPSKPKRITSIKISESAIKRRASNRSQSSTLTKTPKIKGIIPIEHSCDESSKNLELLFPKKSRRIASIKRNESDVKRKSSSRSQSSTPKKTAKFQSRVQTPSSRCSTRSQSCTPRRTARTQSSMPSPKISTHFQSATPKRKTVFKSNLDMPQSSSRLQITPRSAQRIERSIASPSPGKKPKTARRSIQFSLEQEVAITRSGRKIKPVNYLLPENSDDESKESLLSSTIKRTKLSKFLRANYSDESGSEFSASESTSSEDEESASEHPLVEGKISTTHSIKQSRNKTPRSSVKKKHIELSIPKRKTPLKPAQNILEESRLRLHVSAVPKSLPCREEEYSDIYSFVKGCLCAQTGGCMYISGVPGTGKTATVHEVIRNLEEEKEDGDVPLFTFVEVNGMWMTDPYQCYVHIFKSLTGKTIASQQAANLLEKRFTESGPKKDAVVLLVDELDRLWTRKQTVMYNIFDWPSKKHSKLIVLAIANTMDLPERLMMNRISSRLGLTRKTFQPYNFRQLQEIIMSRIQELQVFDPDAVQFVSRKVAAVSGDARRALDICRHATEMAERSKSSPKKKRKTLVGMEHVDEAIQQMFSSPVIAAIKSASKMSRLFLQGILSEFTRTGSEETTLIKVSSQLISCCKYEGIKPPTSSEISNVCVQLAASHLILVDNFQNDIYMKLRLSVSPDDVNYALTGKGLTH